jgi:hypothetical protein
MNRTAIAAMLRDIVQEIHEDGKHVMGPGWTLLPKMTALASNGDVAGMVRYFRRCKASRRGQVARDRLASAGSKTLESEEARFMKIARPYLWRQRILAVGVLVAFVLIAATLLAAAR